MARTHNKADLAALLLMLSCVSVVGMEMAVYCGACKGLFDEIDYVVNKGASPPSSTREWGAACS